MTYSCPRPLQTITQYLGAIRSNWKVTTLQYSLEASLHKLVHLDLLLVNHLMSVSLLPQHTMLNMSKLRPLLKKGKYRDAVCDIA